MYSPMPILMVNRFGMLLCHGEEDDDVGGGGVRLVEALPRTLGLALLPMLADRVMRARVGELPEHMAPQAGRGRAEAQQRDDSRQ